MRAAFVIICLGMSREASSRAPMYKSFRVIDDFVKEVFGFNLITRPMNPKVARIKELKNAYDTIRNVIDGQRQPFSNEFVYFVYPLLEVSVQWAELRKTQQLTMEFLEKCRQRMRNTQSNYYGTLFEIDMASRCLLSNWRPEFVEDHAKREKQIDFVFYRGSEVAGVECLSRRYSENRLTIAKMNKDISEKGDKFKPEYIEKLGETVGVPLAERLLIIDITTSAYSRPTILNDLARTRVSSKLNGVVYTWREDIVDGENHDLIVKYETFGDIDKVYFSTTYAAHFHVTNQGPVFFVRKYVEPEPSWGQPGPLETIEDYQKNTGRVKRPET